jgi:hypothetical protein
VLLSRRISISTLGLVSHGCRLTLENKNITDFKGIDLSVMISIKEERP